MRLERLRCLQFACVLLAALPRLADAQSPSANIPRIGLLAWWPCDEPSYLRGLGEFGPLVVGLDELGYKPGETVTIECRSAGEQYSNLAPMAAELVRLPVEVIVSISQPGAGAAQSVTETIPIVSIVSGDPVAAGLAHSIAKPGGNLTGVSYYATELTAKRLEFLKEMIPGLTIVAGLANPDNPYPSFANEAVQAASRLGLDLRLLPVRQPLDLEAAFSAMDAMHAQAAFVVLDMMLAGAAPRIAALSLEHRLPTMAWGPWFSQAGCLMAYSADYERMNHRLADYVDRILDGAEPGDLPIEQPTTFALSINLKTAKALGLEVPSTLLLRADELIE